MKWHSCQDTPPNSYFRSGEKTIRQSVQFAIIALCDNCGARAALKRKSEPLGIEVVG